MAEFTAGDRVTWKSHGGTATGTVKRKIVADTTLATRTVRASYDDPQYLVESDNGGEAVHRPSALTRSR
jgi:Hypervirulence associated proteins TUDOR domain